MVFHHSVPILYSSDVQKSIEYYINILGFDSKWMWDDPPSFGGVSKNRVELFFCKQAQGSPGTWVAVMVDNVDELYELIRAKGAKILSPPKSMEWNLREMLVEDPDKHVIRFGQSITFHKEKSTEFPESIRLIERMPTIEEYKVLTKAVNWKIQNDKQLETILKAPLYAVIAEDSQTNKVVGCVLLLSDHASFYYVKDVMVHPEYQGMRIGSALMKKLNEWLETNAADDALVGLYTGPNLAPFYSQFGFKDSFGMTKRIRSDSK